MFAAKDMQDFRHSVPNFDDDDDDDEPGEVRFYNLDFYHGRIKSSPDDVHIDEFHNKWWGDYRSLENCHSYIQWLFPIQERGVNWDAHVLTKKEIKAFRKDEEAKRKLVKSYELMLDFYGIRLVNETGEVKRARNWEERFSNLNRYTHNNLRITRILKCLGTLGLQRYQAPLVKFFLHETLVVGHLQRVKQSVLDYFMFAVLDKSERRELIRFAFKNFKPRKQFVWGPKKLLSGEVDEDEQHPDESVKENQKVSVGDAKLGEVHSENEDFGQLTENRAAEDGQQRETSEKTVETGSDKNNKDEQDPDKNNKKAEKQDQETSNDSNEEQGENWVKPHENTDEINKIDVNHPPEGMGSETPVKKDHQNIDKPDIPNKMMGNNTECNQGANEDSQCCSENKSEKENQEMIVDDDGSKKFLSGEVHSKNENFSQLSENKDNSKNEGNQMDAPNHGKENSRKDQQVKTGSNKNDEDDANENSQCSLNNKTAEKQDPETNDSNEETSSPNNLK